MNKTDMIERITYTSSAVQKPEAEGLQSDIEAFLAAGGEIQQIPMGATAYEVKSQFSMQSDQERKKFKPSDSGWSDGFKLPGSN